MVFIEPPFSSLFINMFKMLLDSEHKSWLITHLSVLVIAVLLRSFRTLHQRRRWHPTPVLFPRKSHGWRNLVGCSPWGHKELDTTERLHFHFSLSCIGEGNGNPLQSLENPRDWGAWWAAVYGVAQSRTRLKQLSSSSSSKTFHYSTQLSTWHLLSLPLSSFSVITKSYEKRYEKINIKEACSVGITQRTN